MKLKALVTAEVIREKLQERFAGQIEFTYDGYYLDHEVMPHTELVGKIKDYDILICEYDTISKDVIDAAEKLRLIICCRGGVKSVVDLDAARAKGIVVCNNAGRNAGAVTDLTMAFILDLTRNVTKTSNLIHSGQLVGEVSTKPGEYKDTVWGLDNNSPFIKYRGRSINHMTLGIVGFGNTGRTLAAKAAAFGMRIVAYSPHLDFTNAPSSVTPMSLAELLARADVVSVNCALNANTRDLFTKKEFLAMKKGAYFINAARGEIIVEEDLVDVLKSGHLAGAALDVTRKEPIPADSPLVGCPNLIITPHIGGSSYDVQVCGTEMVSASLTAYLDGLTPPHRVA
jgi:D-3-phosphoglycerate dehydrogenase